MAWPDFDEADEADIVDGGGTGERALKDKSNVALNRSMLANAYRVLVEAGPQGMAQMDFSRKLGIGKLESRAVHRYLQRRELAYQYLADMGRQRAFKLVAKCYKHSNTMIEKLNAEKEKMEELRAAKGVEPLPPVAPDSPEALTDPLQTPEGPFDTEPSLKKIKLDASMKSEVADEPTVQDDEVMVEVTPGSYPAPRTLSTPK